MVGTRLLSVAVSHESSASCWCWRVSDETLFSVMPTAGSRRPITRSLRSFIRSTGRKVSFLPGLCYVSSRLCPEN
jgi:hypothetical protein